MLEDEIQQLRSELRETVDENGRLYKLLKERDFEIKHLKKKMEEDRLAFTGNSVVQAAGAQLSCRLQRAVQGSCGHSALWSCWKGLFVF